MKYTICDTDYALRNKISALLQEILQTQKEPWQIREINGGMQMIDDVCEDGRHEVCFIRADMMGMNGFETMESVRSFRQNLYYIIYSEEEKYALQAWAHMADAFLLAPFDKVQIKRIMKRCTEFFREKDCACLKLKQKDGWYYIRLRNIINLESHAHKVIFNMTDRSSLETYGKLDRFEEEMRGDQRFVRIHKSTMVNANYIRRFSSTEVELDNGMTYSVSRTLQAKAKMQYGKYLDTQKVTADHMTN